MLKQTEKLTAQQICEKIDSLNIPQGEKIDLKREIQQLQYVHESEKTQLELEIEKMLEDRHFFTSLYGNMFDAVVMYDYLNDKVLDCNDSMIKMLGYSREELRDGIMINDILPKSSHLWPDVDMHGIIASHAGLVMAGETFRSPGVLTGKSGEEFIVDVNVIPLYPERGIGFAVVKDVTQQVQIRKELGASVEKYRMIFENSPMAIVSSRLDGFIEMVSPSVLEIINCSIEEVVGKNMMDFLIEEDLPHMATVVEKYLVEPVAQESAFRIRTKEGQLKYVQGIGVPVVDDRGKITRILNMFFDNTKYVQTRKKAQLLESHYSQIFAVSPAFLLSAEYDGKIQLVSPAFEKSLEYESGELAEKYLQDIVVPEDWGRLIEARTHYKKTGKSFRSYYHCRTKTGKIKIFESAGFPIVDEDGLIESVSSVILDNTELYQAQQDLQRKNEELQSYIASNIQLEQFAHIASHDLKTPLRTVGSFTGLLKRKLGDRIDEKESEYFEFIEQGTAQMASLINDLLNYSKVNSQQLERTHFKAQELLDEVLRDLNFIIEESHAEIVLEGLNKSVFGDASKMRQVFQNLIANAIKFRSPDNDCRISLSLTEDLHYFIFQVRDNGIGIHPEFHKTIFERFTHLHPNDLYEGTGMGLAICRKTVEQHGGTIHVESEGGEGSTFVFTIRKQARPAM